MPIISFSRAISRLAEAHPDRPAVTCGNQSITFKELDSRTNRLARVYEQKGVRRDDLVTIALPNSIAFIEACIALWKLGATPQPVSWRLPKKELQEIIDLARPPVIVGVDPDVFAEHATLPTGFVPDPTLSDAPLPDNVAKSWKAPTSGGSTGRPKLIVSGAPSEFDPDTESVLRVPDNSVVLIPGPLYHNGPFMSTMDAVLRGNHLVLMTKFDALETLRLIEKHRVTWTFMVPTILQRIWRLPQAERERYELSSLKMILHSAAACPPWLKEAWIAWLGPDVIHELYGGTEGQGATWISGEEWLKHPGSVGRTMPLCQVKICDEAGNTLPPGQEGEIYFLPDTGPGSTYYYRGATPKAIQGGWETLGDIGYLDEAGYLYLGDRRKDLIISGGANIYPAEVEAAIDSHPKVRSSIVIGLPDEDLGQRVHAIVDAPDGVTEPELLDYLTGQIVRYKIPRSMEFVDHPLRDDAGKARRSALAQERTDVVQNHQHRSS